MVCLIVLEILLMFVFGLIIVKLFYSVFFVIFNNFLILFEIILIGNVYVELV